MFQASALEQTTSLSRFLSPLFLCSLGTVNQDLWQVKAELANTKQILCSYTVAEGNARVH